MPTATKPKPRASKKVAVKATSKVASKTMPKWHPAPEALVLTFQQVMELLPQAESRKVFGYPAAFTNGQMFAGLHQDNMILRLPDEEREHFLQLEDARVFEPMPGRPMREYVVVPPPLIKSESELKAWLDKAFAYARALPPKVKAPRSASKRAASQPKTKKPKSKMV